MTSKTDITVEKLVDMVKTGELSLPEMQRGYVWKADRVRDLLDSLYRGYPSGTILVWETDRGVPSRELAISQAESPFKGHKLLLDGQQRLTSLSSILRGVPVTVHGKSKSIDILFNLDHPEGPPTEEPADNDGDEADTDEEGAVADDEDDDDDDVDDDDARTATFAAPKERERSRNLAFDKSSQALLRSNTWIRAADIFSGKSDQEILQLALPGGWTDPNYKKFSDRLQRVRKIRDYSYVMQVLDRTMEYEEVAEIFVRVNSRGVKLRSSDLALAQITSRWRDSLHLFEDFRGICQDKGFVIDIGLIVRALVVFTTGGQSRFKTVGSLSREHLESQWPKTQANVLWALEYLKSLRINTTALLSSTFLIVALAYYHEFNNTISGHDGKILRRWLLYANARGHFSRGSTESILDADLALIRERCRPEELLESLRRQVGRLEFEARDIAGTSPKSPILPVVFLALLDRNAIDLQSGMPLALPDTGRPRLDNWHFAFSTTQRRGAKAERSEGMEIANIVFISTAKPGKKGLGPADKWALKSLKNVGEAAFVEHCLPIDRDSFKLTSFRAFLEGRRQSIADLLNRFIDGAPDKALSSKQIQAWIDAGEGESVEFKQRAIDDNGQVIEYVSKEVASFLNGEGGVLLIGVDDDGTRVGIKSDVKRLKKATEDAYQKMIADHLMQKIGKPHMASVKVSLVKSVEGAICVVEVERGASSAYVSGANNQVAFWVRVGNQCQMLIGKDVEEWNRTRHRR